MLFAGLLLVAANIVANGDFEAQIGKDPAGWRLPSEPPTWRVAAGAGRNGTRGLVWRDDDGRRYVMAKSRVAVRPGTCYDFGGWIKVGSLSGKKAAVGFYLDWFSADDRWIGGTGTKGVSAPSDWTEVSAVTPPMPGNAAYGVMMAYAVSGSTGEAAVDDVYVMPREVETFGGTWSSAYRNAAVAGRVKLFGEINAFSAVMQAEKPEVTFRIPGGYCEWKRLPTEYRDGFARAEVEVAELRYGRSPIQLLIETNGVYAASTVLYFERFRDRDPRRVTIDSKNRTLVDGRPFFPIGMYAGAIGEKEIDTLVAGGFNCVMPYRSGSLTPSVLDRCAEKGLMVIPNIKDTFHGERYAWREVRDQASGEAIAAGLVSYWKDHPAVLAWYSCDESEESMIPRLRDRQRLYETLDPDHPTWTVLYQAPAIRKYMGAFDVIGTDPYPVADLGQYPKRKDGIRRVIDWTRQTREGVFDGGRPMWQVPQCFDWAIIHKNEAERLAAPSRAPTYEEIRNMTWQCLVGGANGIVFYAYHELVAMEKRTPFAESFGRVSRVAKEIGDYTGFFLGGDSDEIDCGDREVIARRWRSGGRQLVAVVNLSAESRTVTIDGKSVTLPPLGVKVEG